jgi:hypothetical protein
VTGLGVPELLILLPPLGLLVVLVYLSVVRRRSRGLPIFTTRAYLRAIPRTDEERRDAVDLALRGLMLCAIGIVFAPAAFFGLVPLYYGARKVLYCALGLGLVDDGERPRA